MTAHRTSRPAPRALLVTLALTLVTFAAGCGRHYRVADILTSQPPGRVDASRPWSQGGRFGDAREMIDPYQYNPAGEARTLYEQAADPAGGEAARAARNRLQNAILALSDRSVSSHHGRLKAAENNANLLLGAATIGLSGYAAIAAEPVARILSAAAAGAAGTRSLVNEQVFRDQLGESILSAIEADRAHFLETVILPRQRNSTLDYDVEAAIRDAMAYHHKGSFYHGLRLARRAIERTSQQLETAMDMARQADRTASIQIAPKGAQ